MTPWMRERVKAHIAHCWLCKYTIAVIFTGLTFMGCIVVLDWIIR
jgi:hypothetical protein